MARHNRWQYSPPPQSGANGRISRDFPVALVRSLSSFFSAFVLFLGFLWVAWDREKQSWHDKIAGTVVVQMPKGFALL